MLIDLIQLFIWHIPCTKCKYIQIYMIICQGSQLVAYHILNSGIFCYCYIILVVLFCCFCLLLAVTKHAYRFLVISLDVIISLTVRCFKWLTSLSQSFRFTYFTVALSPLDNQCHILSHLSWTARRLSKCGSSIQKSFHWNLYYLYVLKWLSIDISLFSVLVLAKIV